MKNLAFLFCIATFLGCMKSTETDSYLHKTEQRSGVDLYTYEGEHKLAELSSTGAITVTAYQDIFNYEVDKGPISANDLDLDNFTTDSIYLIYEVYKIDTFVRLVAIPIYDIDGEPIINCDAGCGVEHTCQGFGGPYLVCSSCDFIRYSCGEIKGCKCLSAPITGMCYHSKTSCGHGINNFMGH